LWCELSEKKIDVRVLVEAKIVRGRATNIIATPRSLPTKTLLVAHRDSRIFSPGAIDNASGCALLLLSARQRGSPNHGILFTDAEEYGLQGAKHFVKSEQLDKSTEVMNFDSVGAGRLSVVTKSRSGKMPHTQSTRVRHIANRMNLTLASISTPRGSDSDVFIERGFHACWLRGYPTPTATTVEDTIEYVDPATIEKSVRLMKALIA
jgi:Zn-dependent M28 family amino/carboxypeptidase